MAGKDYEASCRPYNPQEYRSIPHRLHGELGRRNPTVPRITLPHLGFGQTQTLLKMPINLESAATRLILDLSKW